MTACFMSNQIIIKYLNEFQVPFLFLFPFSFFLSFHFLCRLQYLGIVIMLTHKIQEYGNDTKQMVRFGAASLFLINYNSLDCYYLGVVTHQCFCLQDMEVTYFHSYIDGVDFVFIDSPNFRHLQDNIYRGSREVVIYFC